MGGWTNCRVTFHAFYCSIVLSTLLSSCFFYLLMRTCACFLLQVCGHYEQQADAQQLSRRNFQSCLSSYSMSIAMTQSSSSCRFVDTMNNRQTPDSSAGAFLTAVLEVQNKRWSTAKGALFCRSQRTTVLYEAVVS